jgi:transposase
VAVGRARFGDRESAKGGDLAGPNPTDRAKSGTNRHVWSDGRGVPVSILLSGANLHDKWALAGTLDAVVLKAGRGVRRPQHCCLDKGYAFRDCAAAVRARGITPHIRQKGEPPLLGRVHGRPRRWVVERTNSWHNRFRALLIRWEVNARTYLALVHLASALIAYQQSH